MRNSILQKGITLLIAVVILSAAISIALGISYIVFSELQINRGARESYKAFFSAESGRECALYYHWGNQVEFSGDISYWNPDDPCRGDCNALPACLGNSVSVNNIVTWHQHITGGGFDYHQFEFDLVDLNSPKRICASVNIKSTRTVGASGEPIKVYLFESLGTNCAASGPAAVNRTIETCYNPEESGCASYFP